MTLNDLLEHPGEWLSGTGPEAGIVLSSRVRLARNLGGHHFASRTDEKEREEVTQAVRDALAALPGGQDLAWLDVASMAPLDRRFLVERHLISREQEEGEGSRGVAIDERETIAVMVNEEDHLRLQSIRGGLQLAETYQALERIDDALSNILEIAFDSDLGYLTACPTNVGTGMRVSVMMHLPALVMTSHIEKAFRAVHDLRLTVRGLYGEGTEAQGEFYQVSNQITIGRSEREIIDDLRATVDGLIAYEKKARERLMEIEPAKVQDRIWRAHATLKNARIMSSEEAMGHLSSVRLGVDLGMISGLDISGLNRIFVYIQPAHLQRMEGRELAPEDRDLVRATYIREQMAKAEAN